MKNKHNIMVIGASGVLGRMICSEVLRLFEKNAALTVSDYKPDRGKALAESLGHGVGFRYVNIYENESIAVGIKGISCVIVCVNQEEPLVQMLCAEAGVHCIDVTASFGFPEKVKKFHEKAMANRVALAVYSGLFPGLSGMMIKEAAAEFSELFEVNAGLLSSVNAQAGFSGFMEMIEIALQPVPRRIDSREIMVPGFNVKTRLDFPEPFGKKTVRLVNYSERDVMREYLNVDNINYWLGLENGAMTMGMALLKKTGIMNYCLENRSFAKAFTAMMFKHNPRKPETAALSINLRGIKNGNEQNKTLMLKVFSDYGATAAFNAALAKIILNSEVSGCRLPLEITTVENILQTMNLNDAADRGLLLEAARI